MFVFIRMGRKGGRGVPYVADSGSNSRVQGSGFRVQGSGFRVQGSGSRVQRSEIRDQRSEIRDQRSEIQAPGGRFLVVPIRLCARRRKSCANYLRNGGGLPEARRRPRWDAGHDARRPGCKPDGWVFTAFAGRRRRARPSGPCPSVGCDRRRAMRSSTAARRRRW